MSRDSQYPPFVEHVEQNAPPNGTPQNGTPQGDGTPGENSQRSALRPMRRILEDMQKPIKPRHLETKTRGGAELTFIPWYRAVRYVEHYTNGHWSKEVVDVSTTDRRIFVTVRVSLHGRDGSLSRMATGTEKLYKVEDGQAREIAYGDPSSNAESMAFRRACANFGLGLDLYEA